MQILIYLFAASFVFMAVALMLTYKRTRHYGVFLLGLTYAISAALAVFLTHWWPLVAGFVLVWVLRFLGLDPDVKKDGAEQSVKE
ncbi:MAG: hypothetical protein ABIS45_18165 [Burkholderiales bacterium]